MNPSHGGLAEKCHKNGNEVGGQDGPLNGVRSVRRNDCKTFQVEMVRVWIPEALRTKLARVRVHLIRVYDVHLA